MTDLMIRDGIVYGMDEAVYHGGPEISRTGLWTLYSRTPYHFRHAPPKESPALEIGRAIHCAILEPDAFAERYAWGPDDRRGKKWTEKRDEAEAAGKTLLTSGDWQKCQEIRRSVHERVPLVRNLARLDTEREVSLFWTDEATGERCRARPDIVCRSELIMIDPKSTTDAAPRAFSRSVNDYGYHVQAVMYQDGWKQITGERVAFAFLAIEKDPPYDAAVYEIEPEAIEIGERIYRQALDTYHHCRTTNTWPGLPGGVCALPLPRYAYNSQEWDAVPDNVKEIVA